MFDGMEESTILLILVLSIVLWVAITYILFRWVFSIKRQLWNQKTQIDLLVRIAQKLGVAEDDDQLQSIQNRNHSKEDGHLD